MSVEEWQAVVDVLKHTVEGKDKNAVLIPDVAYLDYSGEKQECRRFLRCLADFPKYFNHRGLYPVQRLYPLWPAPGGDDRHYF